MKDDQLDELEGHFYMMCGFLGDNIAFRSAESTPSNDRWTTCLDNARLFDAEEAAEWLRSDPVSNDVVGMDKPIPAELVENNSRRIFNLHIARDEDRATLFRLWKDMRLNERQGKSLN